MAETDLTLAEIETKITRILKETVNGDAFSTLLVYDTVNDLYEEVFNQPNKQVKVRKSDHNFAVVPDTTLNGAIVAGALTMTFDDASDLPTAGTVLIDNEFIPYTNKVGNTVTTAASAVSVGHEDGATVRPCYALPATIDKEKGQHLNVNGLPYDIVSVEDILDTFSAHTRQYAIFNGYMVLPENSSDLIAMFTYTPALTRMDDPTDKPTLIPNNFRVSLLVHGSVGKLMLLDGQSGYERYYRPPEYAGDKGGGMFFDALRKFYATYGRGTDMSKKKTSSSIYD
jgi:hypothetical protein